MGDARAAGDWKRGGSLLCNAWAQIGNEVVRYLGGRSRSTRCARGVEGRVGGVLVHGWIIARKAAGLAEIAALRLGFVVSHP